MQVDVAQHGRRRRRADRRGARQLALARADGVVVDRRARADARRHHPQGGRQRARAPAPAERARARRIRERRARRSGRKLPAVGRDQALVPTGAQIWQNPLGTAPGLLIVHQDDSRSSCSPACRRRWRRWRAEFVVPYLRERTGQRVESFTLRTAGVYESQLHERIGAAPQGWPSATLAYLPSYFGVDLRVTVTGSTMAKQVERVRGSRALRRAQGAGGAGDLRRGHADDGGGGGRALVAQGLADRDRRVVHRRAPGTSASPTSPGRRATSSAASSPTRMHRRSELRRRARRTTSRRTAR